MSLSMVKQLRSAARVLGSQGFQETLESIRESDLLGGDVIAANQIADVQRAIRKVRRVAQSFDRLLAIHAAKPGRTGACRS
jgi:hypothetical protein